MKKLKLEEILENTSDLSKKKKVGYVAIIGRPNAGKSTFINSLIGKKVSIVTNIPQTTRKKILAIYNDEDSQIIFFDNPGIHESNKKFNEEINNEAIKSISEAEVILYFIDISREGGKEEEYIKNIVSKANKPVIKVYTKNDLKSKISIPDDEKSVKISSFNKDGFNDLLKKIKKLLPIQNIFFPEDYYTKQDIYFRVSEIIREKVFMNTKEELPHSTFVQIEEINDSDEKLMKIVAYINTETDSQKYIIIGKSGNLITKIGKESRIEIEKIFGKKVFLALRVKVKKGWKKNEKLIKNIFK
ncbi:GTPase Era [Candidatus Gracilibacteria bacterium]|nr:MAG: GTPase Era [Candidatus Gracilibacteria bacterium]